MNLSRGHGRRNTERLLDSRFSSDVESMRKGRIESCTCMLLSSTGLIGKSGVYCSYGNPYQQKQRAETHCIQIGNSEEKEPKQNLNKSQIKIVYQSVHETETSRQEDHQMRWLGTWWKAAGHAQFTDRLYNFVVDCPCHFLAAIHRPYRIQHAHSNHIDTVSYILIVKQVNQATRHWKPYCGHDQSYGCEYYIEITCQHNHQRLSSAPQR